MARCRSHGHREDPLIEILLLLAAIALPGAAVLLVMSPRGLDRPASCGAALALSPGLMGGLVTLLVLAGFELGRAAAIALASFAALSAAALLLRRRRARETGAAGEADPSGPDRRWSIAAFGWAVLMAIGVGLFPLFSEWWRVYSDAWNHIGIIRNILDGGLPPTDPFFAGVRLQYAWVYHVYTAAVEAVTGFNGLALMAVWSSVALGSLLLSVASLARRLHGASIALTLAFVLFGLNALFPVFAPALLVRAMVGDVQGWAEVQRTFGFFPFGGDEVGDLLRSLGGQDFFLNKFMVATPFSIGLALFAAWAACFERWMTDRRRGELVLAALLTLCAGLVHPVVALHLVATTGGLAALALVAGPRLGLARASLVPWGLTVLAGFAPAAIFILNLLGGTGGSHRQLPIDVSPFKIVGLLSCLALGFPFLRAPVRALWSRGEAGRAWIVWLALALALALTFRLPGSGSFFTVDKFSYFVWIPLAITAAPGLSQFLSRRSGRSRVIWLCLLLVPVNGLTIAGRIADPATRFRQPWNQPALVWMREHLPRNAVLLLPYGDWDTGNFVGRDQYMSYTSLVLQLGYPRSEVDARKALVESFFSAESVDVASRERLSALGRPVFAVWTDFSDPSWEWTPGRLVRRGLSVARPHGSGRYPAVYESSTHEVLEVIPAQAATSPGHAGNRPTPAAR